ncbi:hypothetical protein Pmar_PMAR019088 [Perkinsus marinus ATCC 50983]|uniref:Uncharacterized protein n=1 Tax=Perkinsus marinus (strain ATCC 50983 / TXsc) TaxID=423536 RepID=C5KTU2_PERM5|nr:hypothetical protein Pmar_PMAR019088 [Perkinsus marinus ATCC 50983]EER11984.1 hypothetical protein Pmar_PMAR019088 [Perkinsus marinus ATCC 50983]|eukprot:XP_002780189.1 hypothetical protein Pmar_PMAR019088 [Perkinsus marinus ATCC 50983]
MVMEELTSKDQAEVDDIPHSELPTVVAQHEKLSILTWLRICLVGLAIFGTSCSMTLHYVAGNPSRTRLPFLIVGAALLSASTVVIGYSLELGELLGDRGASHTIGLVIFILIFWVYDAASNIVMVVSRSALVDLAPTQYVSTGFFSQTIVSEFGGMCGSYIASQDWSGVTGVNLGSQDAATSRRCHTLLEFYRQIRSTPTAYHTVLLAMMFSWIGWFTAIIYRSHFIAVEVLPNPLNDDQIYELNLQTAARGMFYGSILSVSTSAIFSALGLRYSDALNPRLWLIWGAALTGLGAILILSMFFAVGLFPGTTGGVQAWLAVVGPIGALSMSIPFALTGRISRRLVDSTATAGLKSGLYMGALNIAMCLPQILVSLRLRVADYWWAELPGSSRSTSEEEVLIRRYAFVTKTRLTERSDSGHTMCATPLIPHYVSPPAQPPRGCGTSEYMRDGTTEQVEGRSILSGGAAMPLHNMKEYKQPRRSKWKEDKFCREQVEGKSFLSGGAAMPLHNMKEYTQPRRSKWKEDKFHRND